MNNPSNRLYLLFVYIIINSCSNNNILNKVKDFKKSIPRVYIDSSVNDTKIIGSIGISFSNEWNNHLIAIGYDKIIFDDFVYTDRSTAISGKYFVVNTESKIKSVNIYIMERKEYINIPITTIKGRYKYINLFYYDDTLISPMYKYIVNYTNKITIAY